MQYSFVFILVILFIGCNHKSKENQSPSSQISIKDAPQLPSSNLEIIEAIPLETTSENLMGAWLRIRSSNSQLFVMDEESKQKSIHVFDKSGTYSGKMAEEGDGPEKIPSLNDFYVNTNGELEILSTIGNKSTIYQFGETGEKTLVLEMDYVASSFTKLPNGDYLLYGSYNLPVTKYRIIKVTPSGEITDRYLPNEYSGELLPMTERNFLQTGGKHYFIESFNNRAYRFHNDSLATAFEVDFGSYAIPNSFWEMNIMESFAMLNEKGFANLVGLFESNEITTLECMFQGPFGTYKQLIFVNHPDKSISKIKVSEEDTPVFYHPIGMDQDDNILFLTYHQALLDFLKKSGQSPGFQLPQQEFDYPIIISTTLTP
ncbi:6-bladed beta-propeller [Echinicola soli]|uniref:6-bladed beta-propeller n=1 Tax=Echinicola soli TaxID=2591634 RepID=A0A514CGU5_9BACT|nr:6-bladed beta-propeller [Echinicola soli]QDH79042.1 6-bladed beta-propeller [Echinicola soli]